MGIRFYVPLPGPFAYVPGKKHPKPQTGESTTAAAGNIFARIVAHRADDLRARANDYATIKEIDNPNFTDQVMQRVKFNYLLGFGGGALIAAVYWFWQMGFGALIMILVPLLNLVTVGIPAAIIGMLWVASQHAGDKLFAEVADEMGINTNKHRAADAN